MNHQEKLDHFRTAIISAAKSIEMNDRATTEERKKLIDNYNEAWLLYDAFIIAQVTEVTSKKDEDTVQIRIEKDEATGEPMIFSSAIGAENPGAAQDWRATEEEIEVLLSSWESDLDYGTHAFREGESRAASVIEGLQRGQEFTRWKKREIRRPR